MDDVKIGFIHRSEKPTSEVKIGYFYWIENEGKPEIYFSPDSDSEHMILLNEKISADDLQELVELKSRMDTAEGRIDEIESRISELKNEILSEIDLSPYLKEDDLVDYAKKDDIPTKLSEFDNDTGYLTESDLDNFEPIVELTDSDYDRIAERVNTKELTWRVI